MPIVEVTLTEGRSPQVLRSLIAAVTSAVATSVAAPVESVRVILREVPDTHFAAGDVTIAERRAASGGSSSNATAMATAMAGPATTAS